MIIEGGEKLLDKIEKVVHILFELVSTIAIVYAIRDNKKEK